MAFQLFSTSNRTVKRLNEKIQQAQAAHESADQRIQQAEYDLKEAQADKHSPYRIVQDELNIIKKECEKLFLDTSTLKPINPIQFAAALVLHDRKMSVDEIVEELGDDSRRDVVLATCKGKPPLQFSIQNGEIHGKHHYELIYVEAGRKKDWEAMMEMSQAYAETKRLMDRGEFNLRRLGKLADFVPQAF